MMTDTPTNTDDMIDSRDVIARIEELEDERAGLLQEVEEASNSYTDGPWVYAPADKRSRYYEALDAVDEWDASDEAGELRVLKALAAEASDYADDWEHGETLIRDTYFKEYAQDLAEECGFENSDQWPARCIDWDLAARELQMDYSAVEFDGVTYWIR